MRVLDSDRPRLVVVVEEDSEGLLLGEEVEVRLRFGAVEERLDESVRGVGSSTSDRVDPLGPLRFCGEQKKSSILSNDSWNDRTNERERYRNPEDRRRREYQSSRQQRR